jgi:hypothetical protein
MIIEFDTTASPDTYECDVAVVGAGAVGTMLAVDLARRGLDVILIEGGGWGVDSRAQALNAATVAGRPMSGLENARFRMLGGSTNFWGGQILRFDPIIFQPRPWVESAGWQFGSSILGPYYDRAAAMMGLVDDFSDGEVWKRVGVDPVELGSSLEIFLTRCLLNRSTAHVFEADIRGSALRTLIHANVTSLAMEDQRVSCLAIRGFNGKSGNIKARRVVLAAGTVEIARLLLSPLTDSRPAPWSLNPWLGKGFIDHLEVCAGKVILKDKTRFHASFDNIYVDGIKYLPRIKLTAKGQEQEALLDIAARFEFRSHYKEHLANIKLFIRSLMNGRRPANIEKFPSHILAVWKVAFPLVWRYLRSKRSFNPADSGIDLMLISEQFPTSDSRISLSGKQNALGMHEISVNWVIDGREIETMATFAEVLQRILRESGLADVEIDPRLARRDPSFLDSAMDYYHQMGGARMGSSKEFGVVDKNLLVFGSSNLYVAGAAVFPFSGFGNPTYTAMAVGLRLADTIAEARYEARSPT